MRVHMHVPEVLVKGIKRNKFIACWPECSLVRHRFLVVPSVSLRRAIIRWANSATLYCLTKSSVR